MYKSKIAKVLVFISVFNLFVSVALAAAEQQWPSTASPSPVQLTNFAGGHDVTLRPLVVRTSDGKYISGTVTNDSGGDLYFVKLLSDGTVGDSGAGWTAPVVLDDGSLLIDMVADTNGGAFFAYADNLVNKISSGGTISTARSFDSAATGCGNPFVTGLVADSAGGVYVNFTCDANNAYVSHLLSDLTADPSWTGTLGSVKGRIVPSLSSDDSTQDGLPKSVLSTGGDLIMYTNGYPSGNSYVSKVTSTGLVTGFSTSSPNYLTLTDNYPIYADKLMSDGAGGVYFVYQQADPLGNDPGSIDMQHVDSSGAVITGGAQVAPFDFTTHSTTEIKSAIDSSNNVFAFWGDDTGAAHIQKMNSAGVAQWGTNGLTLSNSYAAQHDGYQFRTASVIADGSGGAIVTYNTQDNHVAVQRVDSSGVVNWGSSGESLSGQTAGDDYDGVLVGTGSSDEAIVLWLGQTTASSSTSEEVFAQYIKTAGSSGGGGSDTSGTETVVCNTAGGIALSAATGAVTFDPRTTNFYNDSTNAALTTALNIEITDTRGYDPSAGNCGGPSTLSIQSSGLTSGSVTLDLDLGTALDSGAFSCTGACLPTTLGDVVTATGNTGAIALDTNLVNFSEAFDGVVVTSLSGANLEVTKPSAAIPTGNYTGTITFTLS